MSLKEKQEISRNFWIYIYTLGFNIPNSEIRSKLKKNPRIYNLNYQNKKEIIGRTEKNNELE